MLPRSMSAGLETGVLILLLGTVAWGTGEPFIFPSRGPTALLLAPNPGDQSVREVIGGHACGVASGLAAKRRVIDEGRL